jgi:hypothetical protein
LGCATSVRARFENTTGERETKSEDLNEAAKVAEKTAEKRKRLTYSAMALLLGELQAIKDAWVEVNLRATRISDGLFENGIHDSVIHI